MNVRETGFSPKSVTLREIYDFMQIDLICMSEVLENWEVLMNSLQRIYLNFSDYDVSTLYVQIHVIDDSEYLPGSYVLGSFRL